MRDKNILLNNGIVVDSNFDMNEYDKELNNFIVSIKEKINILNEYKNDSLIDNYYNCVISIKDDARKLGFESIINIINIIELYYIKHDTASIMQKHSIFISEINKIISICNKYLGTGSNLDVMDKALINNNISYEQTNNNLDNDNDVILVVDDSNLVANFIKKIFNDKYNVVIANDGNEAINLMKNDAFRTKIKTCFLDLNMPNVSGIDVLENFKENGYFVKIPVVIISGVEDINLIDKVNSYPIVEVLSKPFNQRDIEKAIEKCYATYF